MQSVHYCKVLILELHNIGLFPGKRNEQYKVTVSGMVLKIRLKQKGTVSPCFSVPV